MRKIMTALMVLCVSSLMAAAQLRVTATVPNMGMLAREVGGEAVQVRVMASPDRDAHYLEARPSMMAALRRADLVVSVGAELEIGWLPAAIRGANNRRVQPGRPGYFEAARKVDLLQDGKPADRALGDVHPAGNPHVYFDPERMAVIARALAERLAALDPDHAETFRRNADAFARKVDARMPEWREQVQDAAGALAYHSDPDYLLAALNVPLLGHIEALPGIPPTASHLRSLIQDLSGQSGVIWTVRFQPARPGEHLAAQLGWPTFHLPSQVAMDADAEAYFEMIDRWVKTLKK